MTPEEKVALLKKAGVWDVIGYPTCIDKLFDLVAAHEREKKAEQEPVAWGVRSTDDFLIFQNESQAQHYAAEWEFEVTPLYAAPVQQVPVGKVLLHEGDVNVKGYLYNPLPEGTDIYSAPVRTKDLTDDEICEIVDKLSRPHFIDFARAVIAADRSKNK